MIELIKTMNSADYTSSLPALKPYADAKRFLQNPESEGYKMLLGSYQYASDEQLAENTRNTTVQNYSKMVSAGFVPIEVAVKELSMKPADIVGAMVHYDYPVPAQYQYLLQRETARV